MDPVSASAGSTAHQAPLLSICITGFPDWYVSTAFSVSRALSTSSCCGRTEAFALSDKSMRRRLCRDQVIFVGLGRIHYVAGGSPNKIPVERDCPGWHDWKRKSTWPM